MNTDSDHQVFANTKAKPQKVKLISVKLNKDHQIKFTLNNSSSEFLFDMKPLISYPIYNALADISLFYSASFDDDIIFWNSLCDIHIDQLIVMSVSYLDSKNLRWISATKKSYYEYAVNHWVFD